MRIFVTGGAGFIGSNFLDRMVPAHPEHEFVNVDCLTYAANPQNLASVESLPNYSLAQVDITDAAAVAALFERSPPALVVHFAAESHVDRSIHGPAGFVRTNVNGTLHLLEACRRCFGRDHGLFLHVSTDEVYGSLPETGRFTEQSRYDPSSPYSASKAASDHLVRAYHRTYGLPVNVTHCSNNYGPRQFPEKLIPLMILNALAREPLPVYGQGLNVRDWLYVDDHCSALWAVVQRGSVGETYDIGGSEERRNIDVVGQVCAILAAETGCAESELLALIEHVPDRPGHDLRYAIDASKIETECGWRPTESFDSGLRKTVRWYLQHEDWVRSVRSGEYRAWIERQYGIGKASTGGSDG